MKEAEGEPFLWGPRFGQGKEVNDMRDDLKLISMEDVQAEEVQWLWYP